MNRTQSDLEAFAYRMMHAMTAEQAEALRDALSRVYGEEVIHTLEWLVHNGSNNLNRSGAQRVLQMCGRMINLRVEMDSSNAGAWRVAHDDGT